MTVHWVVVAAALIVAPPDALVRFEKTVRPFVETYCEGCHSGEDPAGQLDLSGYKSVGTVTRDLARWSLVRERLGAKEMPPEEAEDHPSDAARQQVIEWIEALRRDEARKNSRDPGLVLARRLSNAEYNYSIRDLTGVDLRPAREFPVDPANPAGFDNSGESLAMSPALLAKYLEAAREVADHLVLKPEGLAFASHPMLVETDRDKYCVKQILDFYARQKTRYGDYFHAAWRFKHRAALGRPKATLAQIASEEKLSPKYLGTVWGILEMAKEDVGPIATLQARWRELPRPSDEPAAVRAGCDRMQALVAQLRKKTAFKYTPLTGKGLRGDGQPYLMWRNRQYATHRTSFDPKALQIEGETAATDSDLTVPAAQRERYEAAFARFSAVFPDAFYVSERGRYFPDDTRDKGRHLSAGFHNTMGYFRDDLPLYELILDAKGQKELDRLWRELDFVAAATTRTYVQYYLNDSGEARPNADGAARPADQEIVSEATIARVTENQLAKARDTGNETAVAAVTDHFRSVGETIRWVEKARSEAEPAHVAALQNLAARASRRPLSLAERNEVLAFSRFLRK